MTPTITGRSTVDELPGPDGRSPLSGDRASTGRLGDRVFGGLAKGAGILVVGIVALVGTFLVIQAVPALLNNNVNFLTSREWVPSGDRAALRHPRHVLGDDGHLDHRHGHRRAARRRASRCSSPSTPPAGCAGRPPRPIDLLAAVPSIVYGFWGLTIAGQYFTPVQHALSKVVRLDPACSHDAGFSAKSTLAFAGDRPRHHGPADHHRDLARGVRSRCRRPTRRAPWPSAPPTGR